MCGIHIRVHCIIHVIQNNLRTPQLVGGEAQSLQGDVHVGMLLTGLLA